MYHRHYTDHSRMKTLLVLSLIVNIIMNDLEKILCLGPSNQWRKTIGGQRSDCSNSAFRSTGLDTAHKSFLEMRPSWIHQIAFVFSSLLTLINM